MDVRLVYTAADMDESAPVIVLVGAHGEQAERLAALARREVLRCGLMCVPVADWNRQLSPWPAEAVFRGGADFAGEADEFFDEMMTALPRRKHLCLMGYSLAGLFALYAATKTGAFERVAALSPSVWYPGFRAYFAQHLPAEGTEFYLSLGRKEEKAGNAVLRSVGDELRAVQALLGGDTPLVMHDGGHYTDVERRMLAAVRWICRDA